MNAIATIMQITVVDRGRPTLRERLTERLERAGNLRCDEHGQSVISVSIHARENGWFDSLYTTCCESLERQAQAIVKDRC
ncbi:MAG TPA: hypothetical protein VF787_12455 [Thermoanaerobaculia bacterium]